MILTIKSVTGEAIKISVKETDTFSDIKIQIEEEHKVDIDIKSLEIEGRPIHSNDNVFNYYNFDKSKEVHLESQICRLCAEEKPVNAMEDIRRIKDKLHILQLKVNSEALSNLACIACVKKFHQFKTFIDSCLKAEKKQLDIIQSHQDICPFCLGKESKIVFVNLSDYIETKNRHRKVCLKEDLEIDETSTNDENVINVPTQFKKCRNYRCELCPKIFRSSERLKFHTEFHLQGSSAGHCEMCQKDFSSEFYFYKHVKYKHLHKKLFGCEHCDKSFTHKGSLNYHMRSHDKNMEATKSIPCEICNKKFVTKTVLDSHMKVVHTIEKSTQQKTCFQCPICKEVFPETVWGISHMEIQHRDHIDDETGYSFYMQSVYNIYVCGFCEKCYSVPDDLFEHMSKHVEPQRYQCKICNEEFKNVVELRSHSKEHKSDGLKDYKEQFEGPLYYVCEFCQKSFIFHHAFLMHIKCHSGPKPYDCRFCSEAFSSFSELKQHSATHNGGDSVPGSEKIWQPFECPICKKMLGSNSSLADHVRTHTKERPFECKICEKKFTQMSQMKAHYKSHSDVKPHKCELCEKSYKRRRELRMHIIKVHQQGHQTNETKKKTRKRKRVLKANKT